eukprot:scaffold5070_cov145-Skeletonema_menzelii.AAC.9
MKGRQDGWRTTTPLTASTRRWRMVELKRPGYKPCLLHYVASGACEKEKQGSEILSDVLHRPDARLSSANPFFALKNAEANKLAPLPRYLLALED